MLTVDDEYDVLVQEKTLEKIVEGLTSDYTIKSWQEFKFKIKASSLVEFTTSIADLNIGEYWLKKNLSSSEFKSYLEDISLEEYCVPTHNWNASKCISGECAQLLFLKKNKYPDIKKLPGRGDNDLRLYEDKGFLKIGKGIPAKIACSKSFDAIQDDTNKMTLLVLKTIDIGKFSDSIGGGHQNDVLKELKMIINTINSNELSFDGKSVDVVFGLNGRSSKRFITECQETLNKYDRSNKTTKIIIGTCEEL